MKSKIGVLVLWLGWTYSSAAKGDFKWQVKAAFNDVPVLASESGELVTSTYLEILVDENSGSVMAAENGQCAMIYFTNANHGEQEAAALRCPRWLNYDIPTFKTDEFNFPIRLSAGPQGDWSREIQFKDESYLLIARFFKPVTEADVVDVLQREVRLKPVTTPGAKILSAER